MESDEIEELIETVNKLTILLLSAQLDEYCTLLLKQLQELLSLKLSEKPQPSDINAKAIVQNQSLPLPSPGYQNLRSEVNDATEKSAAEQATSKDYGPNQGSSGDGPAKKTESLLIPKVSSQKSQPTVRSKRRTRQSVRDSSENAKTKQSRLATSTSLSSTVMGGELIPLSDIKVENPVPISADLIAVTVRLTSISESDTVVKSKRTKHSSVSSAPPAESKDCAEPAVQLGSLLGHQRRHAGERPFRCEECSYRAGQLTHLQQHIRSMHSDVRTIPCPQCDMKFAKKLDLIRHKKAHSAKTYKFKCPKCEFRHDQQKRMAKHALIHQK